jgi:nucleoid-associated protein YgaU
VDHCGLQKSEKLDAATTVLAQVEKMGRAECFLNDLHAKVNNGDFVDPDFTVAIPTPVKTTKRKDTTSDEEKAAKKPKSEGEKATEKTKSKGKAVETKTQGFDEFDFPEIDDLDPPGEVLDPKYFVPDVPKTQVAIDTAGTITTPADGAEFTSAMKADSPLNSANVTEPARALSPLASAPPGIQKDIFDPIFRDGIDIGIAGWLPPGHREHGY